ncbi:uncharacterized protein LOC131383531 [Hylobates moloch]|uniref:uncharacterized protein LOC131383531 n=1 Tax=Hylobates moloch TaxID=81572 RepID=UPI002675CACA|nr:uncharacterized protein LOC131383531 [Hylobates moloch]
MRAQRPARGHCPAPQRPPAETQQGPYATAPRRGSGWAAQGGQRALGYLREGRGPRHRRPPRPGRAASHTVRRGVLRGSRSLPAARRRARPSPGSREEARVAGREADRRARPGSPPDPSVWTVQGGARQGWAGGSPGDCRWQEGGDESRCAGRGRAGFVIVRIVWGPFKPEQAGRKCVTGGTPLHMALLRPRQLCQPCRRRLPAVLGLPGTLAARLRVVQRQIRLLEASPSWPFARPWPQLP